MTTKVTSIDLVSFARQIVDATDLRVDIPIEILDVTKDVISGRRLCAKWYAALQTKDNKSNEQHAYFIGVLEQVFDILRKEHKARRPKRKKKMPDLATDVNDLNNLYCHLELEEADAEDAGTSSMARDIPKRSSKEPGKVEDYEFEPPADERLCAIWSLLNDLLNIRTEIRLMWYRYSAGEVSLLAASIATTNAMDLVTCLTDDLATEYPDLSTYSALIDVIGSDWYIDELKASRKSGVPGAHAGDADNTTATASAKAWLCVDAWTALGDLARLVSWTIKPQQPLFMDKTPTLTFEPHPFICDLYSIAKYLLEIAKSLASALFEDIPCLHVNNATLLILRAASTEEPTAAAVTCTQIYMDIYDILNGDLGSGLEEAKDIMDRVCRSLEQSCHFMTSTDPSSRSLYPQELESSRRDVRATFHMVELKEGTTAWHYKPLSGATSLTLPEHLMRKLPLLSMWCAYKMLISWQRYAASHCDFGLSTLATAHLYSAARLSGILQEEWTDMEAFIAAQNKQGAFLRQGDGTLLALAKHYGMALGMTLAQVTRGSKAPLPKQSHILRHHRNVDTLHAPQVHIEPTTTGSGARVRQQTLSAYYDFIRTYAKHSGIKDLKIAQQCNDNKRVSPQQLVPLFLESFVEYEPQLRANHIGLADAASEVLAEACCADVAQQMKLKRGRDIVKSAVEMIYHVLWDAGVAEMRGLKGANASISAAASKIVEILARPSGGTCFGIQALQHCSQHILYDYQPAQLFAQGPRQLPDLSRSGVARYLSPTHDPSIDSLRLGFFAIDDMMRGIPTFEEWKGNAGHENAAWEDYSSAIRKQCGPLYDRIVAHDDHLKALQPALTGRRQSKNHASYNLQSIGLMWMKVSSQNGVVRPEDSDQEAQLWYRPRASKATTTSTG